MQGAVVGVIERATSRPGLRMVWVDGLIGDDRGAQRTAVRPAHSPQMGTLERGTVRLSVGPKNTGAQIEAAIGPV